MKKLISLTLLLSIPALFFSCNRDTEMEGPLLVDLFADFEFTEELSISRDIVDFSTGQNIIFKASFNKQANWELTIKGLESHATKIITGFSRSMDESNALWEGSTTELPMFKTEKCLVDLFIPEDSTHITDTVEIVLPKVNEGLLIADFESGAINPSWRDPLVQSGANMSFRVAQDTSAAQGNYYYDMGGEVNWDYLIGLLYIDAAAYGGITFDLAENPDDVWFNFMLWVPDEIDNAIVLFQFREDENENDNYEANSEDMWAYEMTEFESGWQLISLPYSELQNLVNGQPADPNGNALHEPNKLRQIQLLFLADPASGYSQAFLDYVIFTNGGPLIP